MTYKGIRAAGAVVALHKEAGKAKAVEKVVEVLGGIPRIVRKGFKTMGEETAEIIGGTPGRVAGFAVKMVPAAATVGGVGYLTSPIWQPYMSGKMQQFRLQQAATQPYYDPSVGRFV